MTWDRDYLALRDEILSFVNMPFLDIPAYAAHPLADEECFNSLALRIFKFQLHYNPLYRSYAEQLRRTTPANWREIPSLWTSAFKRARVTTFPPDKTVCFFKTSGTTEGESGIHEFCDRELYRRGALTFFRAALLADNLRMKLFLLTPPPVEAPHSSLVFMLEAIRKKFAAQASRYYLRRGRLNSHALIQGLIDACRKDQPVFLLGTAFAFAFLLQDLSRLALRLCLPRGSRIMETGGFKGRVKEIPRDEFYAQLEEALGIPRSHIVNEYGMTELSSQFYDRGLAETLTGRRVPVAEMSLKVGPPWTRVLIVDPITGEEVPPGKRGLIRVYDLANLGSVVAIQTEDIGVRCECGFEILGRAPSAPPRGCSLDAETLFTGDLHNERVAVRKDRGSTARSNSRTHRGIQRG
ncbi:MAG: long-chain fatty acid--CoA ligase [Candidatus Sumerlaeaceae bacterium]